METAIVSKQVALSRAAAQHTTTTNFANHPPQSLSSSLLMTKLHNYEANLTKSLFGPMLFSRTQSIQTQNLTAQRNRNKKFKVKNLRGVETSYRQNSEASLSSPKDSEFTEESCLFTGDESLDSTSEHQHPKKYRESNDINARLLNLNLIRNSQHNWPYQQVNPFLNKIK